MLASSQNQQTDELIYLCLQFQLELCQRAIKTGAPNQIKKVADAFDGMTKHLRITGTGNSITGRQPGNDLRCQVKRNAQLPRGLLQEQLFRAIRSVVIPLQSASHRLICHKKVHYVVIDVDLVHGLQPVLQPTQGAHSVRPAGRNPKVYANSL